MRKGSPCVLAGAILLLGACSPYLYKDEVGSLASGLNAAATAITAADGGTAGDVATLQIARWSLSRSVIVTSGACDDPNVGAGTCALKGPGSDRDATITLGDAGAIGFAPTLPPEEAKRAQDFIAALTGYAAALQGLVNAQDRTDFDTAVGKLKTASSNFSKAVPHGAARAPIVGDSVGLLGTLVGAALDQAKYDELKKGVEAIQTDIDKIGLALRERIELSAMARAKTLQAVFAQDRTTYEDLRQTASAADRLALLQRMAGDADALNKARAVNPQALADAFVKAHTALYDALKDNAGESQALADAVTSFASAAEKVSSDLASATPAAAPKTGAAAGARTAAKSS